MWADLAKAGMVSGHAYGKSLRTVKTCVGSEHCRFGTQLAMGMGVKLEKMLFGMWSPHKVKLAVSGCPRNCAEAGIKDVGVIGVDSGYEIYVAGNGGIKTEVAQFLCKVSNDEEVLEYTGAFLQLYREEARYLDRTVHYVNRVGLDHVKKLVVEDAVSRKALHERLLFARIRGWTTRRTRLALSRETERARCGRKAARRRARRSARTRPGPIRESTARRRSIAPWSNRRHRERSSAAHRPAGSCRS
jgi:NAD(P)H-nitrite reductase large subunit